MKVLSVASKYSDQPEEKVITISRIGDAACPFKYFKGYVERPKTEKSFETIEAGMGSFFHRYVENHFKRLLARDAHISRQDVLDLNDLLSNFRLAFLWQGKIRPPYRIVRSTYTLEDFLQRLEVVGNNFNQFAVNRLTGHQVLSVEGHLQIRTNSFYIRGKHDLVTKEPRGQFVLWDWKTGAAPKPEYYEQFRNLKIQLGIYAIWMKHKYDTSAVQGRAVFMREQFMEHSETFTDSVEKDVLDYLGSWRRRLNAQTSYPPILNNLCDWCGWNPVCPAYQDH